MLKQIIIASMLFVSLRCVCEAAEPLVRNLDVIRKLAAETFSREHLEITPEQGAELKKLAYDESIIAKWKTERNRLRRVKPNADPESLMKDAQHVIDEEVFRLATKIISENQFRLAKNMLIRETFPTPVSILHPHSRQYLKGLGIELSSADEDKIKAIEPKFVGQLKKIAEDIDFQMAKVVPENARQPLVNYLGNKHFPNLEPIDADFDESLYGSPILALVLPKLRSSVALSQELKITDGQRKALDLFATEIENLREGLTRGATVEQIKDGFLKASRFEDSKVREILTLTQKRTLFRMLALQEFERDPKSVFDRLPIQKYLKLSRDEIIQLNVAAIELTSMRSRLVEKLEQQTFEEICSNLNADESAALRSAFQNVWQ